MEGSLNYIDLITFTLYITTFITPIRKLATLAEIFTNGVAGLKRFAEIMRIKPSIKESDDPVRLTDVKGDIELKTRGIRLFRRTRCLKRRLPEHKSRRVCGNRSPSGGGKTTMCQLIPRFYDVDGGSITIDGVDIRDISKSSLRSNIGIVQQDVFLFAATIFENIRYGRPEATFEEVAEAARKAEIYEDIMDMKDGFDTYVGERGTLLSGGQKQRISIARIFLKNPPILILDEATSALDSITEQQIQRSFSQLSVGRTTLIIAHRLATIRDADRIVLVEDGEIKKRPEAMSSCWPKTENMPVFMRLKLFRNNLRPYAQLWYNKRSNHLTK